MTFLSGLASRVPPMVGSALFALGILSSPSLAQEQILSGRIPLGDLTPAQRAVVDKITRSPETANVSVIKRTGGKEQRSPENPRVILPLSDGKEITLIRARNTVKTERGFTWRGVTEETGERPYSCCGTTDTSQVILPTGDAFSASTTWAATSTLWRNSSCHRTTRQARNPEWSARKTGR